MIKLSYNKKIGYGQPCFIIAEAGANHNGQEDMAFIKSHSLPESRKL